LMKWGNGEAEHASQAPGKIAMSHVPNSTRIFPPPTD
jgi:hypothetical protein